VCVFCGFKVDTKGCSDITLVKKKKKMTFIIITYKQYAQYNISPNTNNINNFAVDN